MGAAIMMTVASVAACGGSGGNGGNAAESAKVGYSVPSLGDAYRVVLNKQVISAASSEGMTLLPAADANNDAGKQISDITTMLGQGIGGILTVVFDSKAIKPALDRAAQQKVPVVAIDQGPAQGKVAMTVRGDNELMGSQSCKVIGKQLDGKGKVLELQGDLDGLVAQLRSRGFNECIKKDFPGIQVVSKPTEWLQENATTAARTVLSTDPDVKGIFLASDSAMLPGVIEVLKRLDRLKKVGADGHVPLVSIDGSPFSLDQVREGYVDGVVSQPLGGYAKWAAYYLKKAMNGETFKLGPTDHDSVIVQDGENVADNLKTPVVTKENVEEPTLWGNQAKSAK